MVIVQCTGVYSLVLLQLIHVHLSIGSPTYPHNNTMFFLSDSCTSYT